MLKLLQKVQVDRPIVRVDYLADFKLSLSQIKLIEDVLGVEGYSFSRYTSYAVTDKARNDKPANYALIPNQYFLYAVSMYEFATALYEYFDIFVELRKFASDLVGNEHQIVRAINQNIDIKTKFDNDEDIELFAKFLDKDDSQYRLGSKRLINDKGEPRGARDCFGSVILKEINLPDVSSSIFGRLVFDLCQHPNLFKTLFDSHHDKLVSLPQTIRDIAPNLTNLPKPFILLAGISGTGKTRFIREQARRSGGEAGTCCLVPVRPDWHEPSDILGYVSRLNGCAEYVTTDVLRFVAKAWLEILEAGVELDCDASGQAVGEFKALGNHDDLAAVRPFWLCLDEMNLAPVEQYFADYLSVIETREWVWDGDEFEYRCEPLLKPDVIQSLDEDKQIELRQKLGFGTARFDSVWQLICQTGLAIPFNLIVAGTVNMDETTHGFSRKVIDRALSIDFGEFFPNDFDQVFESSVENEVLSYPILSRALPENLPDIDKDGKKTIEFLKQVNGLLLHTPFELAFRTMNELLLAVVSFEPQSELELKAVWDDFLVCKVLPRIEGDVDKLATKDTEKSLLDSLFELLSGEFELLWREKTRPDLLRQMKSGDDKVVAVACRSKAKLEQMRQKLERSGFTTFWP